MSEQEKAQGGRTWSEWFAIVAGWLACAASCLYLSLLLEPYPAAYDTFFPLIILLLFGNVFIFFFIASRWNKKPKRLYLSVLRVFVGEAIFLAGIFFLGRYAFA